MTTEGIDERHKSLLQPLRLAQYHGHIDGVREALRQALHPGAVVRLATPFEDLDGADGFFGEAYAPLARAIPDLERRDQIVIAGRTAHGTDWVGCCGFFTGTFARPWLDIPPTGHVVGMRFHEFYRFVDGRVAEVQALWDIPELMLQAGAWPMGPALGREWQVPGPATQDGLRQDGTDAARSARSLRRVCDMLAGLARHALGGVEAMELERHWHPRFNWYGPSGIGTGRGIAGFRHWHQIPFLAAMPDRRGTEGQGEIFAQGDHVAVTGWPNMRATITGDGWMGIAPAGQSITMRSLDFWRCEDDLIRENWVLVDLLHVYRQIGVDVLDRMRAFGKARTLAVAIPI